MTKKDLGGLSGKEQQRFDKWWYENRTRLITIYNKEIDLNLAVMDIAEAVWEEALNAKAEKKIDQA